MEPVFTAAAWPEWPLWLLMAALAGAVWFSVRYAWWRRTQPWDCPRVLMYHMVTPHPPGTHYRGLRVKPEEFEKQLRWLRRKGVHFGTMRELASGGAPPRTVVLTFDDGYADNFTTVHPLLQKYGAKATLYLVAVRDDGADWSAKKKAHHDSGELVREPKLTDAHVREMLAGGLWELGAHTLTHPLLTSLTPEQRRAEIGGSRRRLEETFGVPVETFAYAFGIWCGDDRAAVAEAGFVTAVTTDQGVERLPLVDPLAVKRIKISGKEGMPAFSLRVLKGRRGLWK